MFKFLKRLFRGWTKTTRLLRAYLAGGIPSYWTTNPQAEIDANVGWNYVAIEAIATNVSQATLSVAIRDTDSAPSKKNLSPDDNTQELPRSHQAVRLLRRPNPEQSLAAFLHAVSQQLSLHGDSYVWGYRGEQPEDDGTIRPLDLDEQPPQALYVLPKRILFPQPASSQYPFGSFRIQPYGTFTGPLIPPEQFADPDRYDGPSTYASTLVPGKIIDMREVKIIKLPDPACPGAALSPVTQTGHWSDIQKQIFETQWSTLHNNVNPSLILEESEETALAGGLRFEDRDQAEQQLREKQQGPNNQSNAFFVPTGTKLVQVGRSAVELDYNNSATQNRDALLAAHRVTPAAVGLMAAGGNATYYVQMQAFVDLTVQPRLNLIAEELTEILEPFWPGIEVKLTARQFNDRAQAAVRVGYLATNNLATINEIRAIDGLPADPRFGHLTPGEFKALIEAGKVQPSPVKEPAIDDNQPDLTNRQPDKDRTGVRDPSRDIPAGSPRSNGTLAHLRNGQSPD